MCIFFNHSYKHFLPLADSAPVVADDDVAADAVDDDEDGYDVDVAKLLIIQHTLSDPLSNSVVHVTYIHGLASYLLLG